MEEKAMNVHSLNRLFVAATLLGINVACSSGSDTETTTGNGVTDSTPPVVSLAGNEQIEVAFNAVFRDLGAVALDNVDGELPVVTQGDVNTSAPGDYQLVYSATDSSGNTGEVTRTVTVLDKPLPAAEVSAPIGPPANFFDGALVGADYWSETPEILSAGMGFADILGLDAPALSFEVVSDAGGAWNQDYFCGDDPRDYTSAATQDQLASAYIHQTPYGELKDGALGIDGLPIVFSWPVDTSTINLSDFQLILNTGDIVRPLAVSAFPNFELNERNTVAVFGEFGNRLPSSDPDSRFPIRLEIVEDDTPLLLVGPDNQVVSAVGLSWETSSSPYDENNGPRLVGAKLNRIAGPMAGEGFNSPVPLPTNDHTALYDEGDFMLRMLTSGGYSPNGVNGVRPNEFERFFRLHALGADGSTVIIDEVGREYAVQGGTLRVVGLADLGRPEGGDVYYDECYDEDLDNYIDIILVGDENAARSIQYLEVPSLEGGYSPMYNPGGPGSTPFDGVVYSAPGPADLEPVIIALDDPMRVTYNADAGNSGGAGSDLLTVDVDGVTREYLLTVPGAYSGDAAVPLMFNFHGLNGTAQNQLADSQLDRLAEQEGFILVTPQAIDGIWTVTGFPVSNGADDFGFINALIDDLSANYNIDASRIYATGMSQGGFLALDLVCNFSDRFAAIAPVSGVLTTTLQQTCSPERFVPVLQTHGTADSQIPYDTASATVVWLVNFNQTSTAPEIEDLPDPFPANGTTVRRYTYSNSATGIDVEHLQIQGGQHVWPGSNGNSDIDMAQEVWNFVSRFDLNGPIED
jgi:poly(3-hydroxybutyrate) depolymerase